MKKYSARCICLLLNCLNISLMLIDKSQKVKIKRKKNYAENLLFIIYYSYITLQVLENFNAFICMQ